MKQFERKFRVTGIRRRAFLGLLTAIGLVGLSVPSQGQSQAGLDHRSPRVQAVMALQNSVTPEFMGIEGILGTATGVNAQGAVAVIVYVNQNSRRQADLVKGMPKAIRGTPLVVELTDEFRALGKPGATPGRGKPKPPTEVDHKAKQDRPILLGTSGGWGLDLANGYCCGGTLGSLIQIGGVNHILSNYHVLESDIVSGGNGVVATIGDPIIQPGLIDVGCDASKAQVVATLVPWHSLPDSNVDAAVAVAEPGMVDSTGAILEIGAVSSQTATASIGQAVKKSGRTTGLTRSSVSGLNATVSVTYEDECAGATAFTKTFTGQIIIKNRRSSFLAGGDSGSLMVEDVDSNPRAVGLLFAGSSTTAVANPIDEVLIFFGATMVGN